MDSTWFVFNSYLCFTLPLFTIVHSITELSMAFQETLTKKTVLE